MVAASATVDSRDWWQDLSRVNFARRSSGGGRETLHPVDTDGLENLITKSRRVARLVLSGGSIADVVGALPSGRSSSDDEPSGNASGRRTVEHMAQRTFPPAPTSHSPVVFWWGMS